jgi:hypothetical protein
MSISQSPRGAMVAVDHRHPAPAGQRCHDAGAKSGRKMIDVLPVNACMFEPVLQRSTVDEMHGMASAQFPSDADVEAERKDLVELFSRNVLGPNDGTCGRRLPRKRARQMPGYHGGRIDIWERRTARIQASESGRFQVASQRLPSRQGSSRYCLRSREVREWLPLADRRQSDSLPSLDRR